MGSIEGSMTNRRVSIPQQFRNLIAPSSKMQVVAVRGKSNTIYIFPLDNWRKLEEQLESGSDQEKSLLKMFRFYATTLKIEGPGRILLPKNLIEIAQINNKIIFLGEGQYFSIWEPARFAEYEEQIAQQYDEKIKENEFLF